MRMSKLIKDMLLLASSDSGTRNINKTMVNIDTLLIALYEAYEPICGQKGIPLDADFMDIHFPVLYTDREYLFQILSIFMDNAISHSETKASIQIKATLSRKAITISVIDHGQGISAEDKPYIFDRFYCADKSHTDKSHFWSWTKHSKRVGRIFVCGCRDKEYRRWWSYFFSYTSVKTGSPSTHKKGG